MGGGFHKFSALGTGGHRLSVLGGGHRGSGGHQRTHSDPGNSKAKMGMLIIHGPGQDMLDLLVAANIAAFMKRLEGWAKERNAIGGF